jgi:uncharacterized protein
MKRKTLLGLLILLLLALKLLFAGTIGHQLGISGEAMILIYQAGWYLVPMLPVMLVFYRPKEILHELGLASPLVKGFFPALVITLPMFASYAFFGEFAGVAKMAGVFGLSLFAGFFEEVWFRGFVFGQLFRRAGWGFIPAVLANGLLFGLGHLYQTSDPGKALMVFFVTFAGAGWFSWLFIESGGNLWLPVSLHFLMNLSWGLFSMDDTAAGGFAANIPRIATITFSIMYILIFVKRGGALKVRAANLWINRHTDDEDNSG